MNKKFFTAILAVGFLFSLSAMFMTKAEAATPGTLYSYSYRIVFYTTNQNVYDYLKARGYNVVLKTPAPIPNPAPVPTPIPAPTPIPTPAPVNGLTEDEQKMLNFINQERSAAGVKPLQADLTLAKLARMKSQDMIDKNYFSHTSPIYGSPFDMMKKYGVTYRYAGENLAGAWAVDVAHTNLMNSPGHRQNILNSSYTHVGIGVVKGGPYGMIFTQMFVGR